MDVAVDPDQVPAEGEVLILTSGGAFLVKGTIEEAAQRLAAEEWPVFELAESGDKIILKSDKAIALREGTKRHRGAIGFTKRA